MEDEKYFRQTVDRIIETREWTKERLRELGFHFPDSSANFIFAAHEKAEGKALFEALKQEKIYVRHFDKDRIRNYLRITIGTREEMETLLTTLKRLLQQY
jgi:histidinol-phosphate aminotransferase